MPASEWKWMTDHPMLPSAVQIHSGFISPCFSACPLPNLFPQKCKSRYHKGICFYIDKKVRRENSSRRYDKPSSNAVDHVQDALHSFLPLFNRMIAETVSEGNGLFLPGYTRNYPVFIRYEKIPNRNCHCEAGQNPDHNGSFQNNFIMPYRRTRSMNSTYSAMDFAILFTILAIFVTSI